jgi:hypothetical protein
MNPTPAQSDAAATADQVSRAYEVPLVERLLAIPKDYRAEIETQWAEDGAPTGHRFIPVGHLMHIASAELAASGETIARLTAERDEACDHARIWPTAKERIRVITERAEQAEQSVTRLKQELGEARAAIKDFAVIAKLHDKPDAMITIRQGLKVWTSRHAEAIKDAALTGEAKGGEEV